MHEFDHFADAINMIYHHSQAMNDKNYQTTTSNVDISSDMLNLLAKCSNIVADVKKAFGYVPIL